jgi:NADH pyrophosphatase NudC (nudix superfamily)
MANAFASAIEQLEKLSEEIKVMDNRSRSDQHTAITHLQLMAEIADAVLSVVKAQRVCLECGRAHAPHDTVDGPMCSICLEQVSG